MLDQNTTTVQVETRAFYNELIVIVESMRFVIFHAEKNEPDAILPYPGVEMAILRPISFWWSLDRQLAAAYKN